MDIKRKRGFKGLMAVALAAVTALTIGTVAPATAKAADATTYDPTKVVLTKVIDTSTSITTSAETFAFTFTPVSVNDDVYVSGTNANMPSISGSITFTAGQTKGTLGSFIPTTGSTVGTNFTHAGEYVYTVAETAGTTPDMTYSGATYTMRVYVENTTDGGLTIKGVTIQPVKGDDGKAATSTDKVDPTEATAGDGSAFKFTNTLTASSPLKISKTVEDTNKYGDQTKKFTYAVTFAVPTSAGTTTTTTYTATLHKADASTSDVSFTTTDGINFATTTTIQLADGEYLDFTGTNELPVGTTYSVVETGETNYTPSPKVTYSRATGDNLSTTLTKDAAGTTLTGGSTATVNTTTAAGTITSTGGTTLATAYDTVGAGDDNATVITNTYKDVSPTGIIIQNLPFIIMGIVAVGGIALLALSRRRKNNA